MCIVMTILDPSCEIHQRIPGSCEYDWRWGQPPRIDPWLVGMARSQILAESVIPKLI